MSDAPAEPDAAAHPKRRRFRKKMPPTRKAPGLLKKAADTPSWFPAAATLRAMKRFIAPFYGPVSGASTTARLALRFKDPHLDVVKTATSAWLGAVWQHDLPSTVMHAARALEQQVDI